MKTKKNEPLKEKVIVGDPHEGIKFKFEDVKSAVQGLLEEIEELKRSKNPYSENIFPEPTKEQWKKRNEVLERAELSPDQFSGSLCRLGWNNSLDDVKNLIKKWFPDVLEEVDEK